MAMFRTDGKAIMAVFIGAIIAATLIVNIADEVVLITNDNTITNTTVTAPAVNGTLDLTGRDLVTSFEVYNATNNTGSLSDSGVYLQTGKASDGLNSVQLVVNDTGATYASQSINITYSYRPDGHVGTGAGNVSITRLITLFAALAILVFVVVVFISKGSLGTLMGRRR